MITISSQHSPNLDELTTLFSDAFSEIDSADQEKLDKEDCNQSLAEWFSVEEMNKYLPYGELLEARNEDQKLVGAVFIGKQNPISWLDGNKTEIFILAVHPQYRLQGIGKKLLLQAEGWAKEIGSQKLIINTHVLQERMHKWYLQQGYNQIGTLKNYYANGDAVFFLKNL